MQIKQLQYSVLHFPDFKSAHIPEIFEEIYLQNIYFPFLAHRTDAIVFDIGFNIGLFSLYASPHAKQIYSFEPSKELYDVAVLNMKENNVPNVKTFQKAIAPEDGKMTFYHSTNKTMFSLNPAINDNKETEEVETIRLDTFCKQEKIEHIDFMKLDIEGTESKVFTSESFKNIVPMLDCMVYEWHQWDGSNPSVINHGLFEYGFKRIAQLPSKATVFACSK